MTRIQLLAALLLSLGLAAAPAAARDQPPQRPERQRQADRQDSRSTRLSGQLTDLRTLQIAGLPERHLVGKVRLQDGRTALVDLGPVSNLRQQRARFRRDQQADFFGRPGRINQRPVLIVDRVVGDGAFTVIAPGVRQPRQRQAGDRRALDRQMRADRHPTVLGTVRDTRRVNASGAPEPRVIATLLRGTGQTVTVDLGPASDFRRLRIDPGDLIAATGPVRRLNDRPVLVADRVATIQQVQRHEPPRNAMQVGARQSP